MSRVDTGPLRQLYHHLGIEPLYVMPSLAAWQLQQSPPPERLPASLMASVDKMRDLVVMSRNYLQIGVFEFTVGLEFLHTGRAPEAIQCFEAAKRQWTFIDHLPLLSLANLGIGVAYHTAGEYRPAAAAYFKVKQCLEEAENEPQRLEEIEAERSLQSFWNDLERWLMLAMASLRRAFDAEQGELLRSDLGEIDGDDASHDTQPNGAPEKRRKVTLRMQSVEAMSASDVNVLLFQTLTVVEALDKALTPAADVSTTPRPLLSGISFAEQGEVRLELAGVRPHTLAFCRRLLSLIPAEGDPDERRFGVDRRQPPEAPADESGPTDDRRTRFQRQLRSGHLAGLLKAYVKKVASKELDEDEVNRLMVAVEHLAEMRMNHRLSVEQG